MILRTAFKVRVETTFVARNGILQKRAEFKTNQKPNRFERTYFIKFKNRGYIFERNSQTYARPPSKIVIDDNGSLEKREEA